MSKDNEIDYYLLGLLNSKLINWFFAKLSTNSNVNGYEIDGLPIKEGTKEQKEQIVALVKELLKNPVPEKRREIDQIVYDVYGITEYEVPIIEG